MAIVLSVSTVPAIRFYGLLFTKSSILSQLFLANTVECDKSFSCGTTNFHQQNPYMTTEIHYCIIYYLFYQEFLTVCVYP